MTPTSLVLGPGPGLSTWATGQAERIDAQDPK